MRRRSALGFAGVMFGVAALVVVGAPDTIAKANTTKAPSPIPTTAKTLTPIADAVASELALAKLNGKSIAIVADEDDSSLHVFTDVDGGASGMGAPREIGVTKLTGRPGHVLVSADGRVFVAIRDKGSVLVFDVNPKTGVLAQQSSINTGGEPIGLGLTADNKTLLVSSGWTGEVFAHSATAPFARTTRLSVAREPRTIAVDKKGHAYVSHAVGGALSMITLNATDVAQSSVTKINTSSRGTGYVPPAIEATVTPSQYKLPTLPDHPGTQSYALAIYQGRVYAPEVFAEPERGVTYYGAGSESFGVLLVDEGTGAVIETSRDGVPQTQVFSVYSGRKYGGVGAARANNQSNEQCLLPRAVAIDPETQRVLVGCAGSSTMLDFDAIVDNPARVLRRKLRTDDSPSAIAVDGSKHNAIVWSQMSRSLSVVSLSTTTLGDVATPPTLVAHASGANALAPDVARGRRIFHTGGDGRIANDGRACASCHPDGRDDGIAWLTPDGPRQTAMLAGRVNDTAPYGWTRARPTLESYISDTIQRLNGSGLAGPQLHDLVAYVKSLQPPPTSSSPWTSSAASAALATRGKEIFDSPQAACGTCHAGSARTDGIKHDVLSAVSKDKEKAFETPSLRFVGRTAPYFHDGRYTSLKDLLVKEDGKMGHTAHLTDPDRNALEVYLQTL